MTDEFKVYCTDFLFVWEGVQLENVQDDPGGLTKFGIDQRSHPKVSIQDLDAEAAMIIYWSDYVDSEADIFAAPCNFIYFDAVVNVGLSQAIKFAQGAAKVPADGIIGPVTQAAIKYYPAHELGLAMIQEREAFYHRLSMKNDNKFKKFLKGWLNRCEALKQWTEV